MSLFSCFYVYISRFNPSPYAATGARLQSYLDSIVDGADRSLIPYYTATLAECVTQHWAPLRCLKVLQ